ncbi:MAG: Uma2 family endonuclease [Chloroflexota bacterium]
MAATTKTLLTADEFYALPSSEGKQELVRGEVIEMAPPGGGHGYVQLGLGVRMRLHADHTKQGFVVTEVGFRLATGPDLVRAPDVAFVAAARFPEGRLPETYIDGAPDIAVEVVSPSDTFAEVEEKVQEYLDAGARLVWVAQSRAKAVRVYTPDGTSRTLRGDDVLSGDEVMPGFEVRVAELFSA